MDKIKLGWILLTAFALIAGCWIGYGAFFYAPVGVPLNRGLPAADQLSERAAREPSSPAEEKRPPEGDRDDETIVADAWDALSPESTMTEIAGWERVGPGAWLIPGTAIDPAWESPPVPHEIPAGAEPAASAVTPRGGTSDPRRASSEAEIRVEYRNLERAREAYRQATKRPYRRAYGLSEGALRRAGIGGGPLTSDAEERAADAAWSQVCQQAALVRGLLDAYSRLYGQTALGQFTAQEGIDMAPIKPRYPTPEQRRDMWTAFSEEMGRAESPVPH